MKTELIYPGSQPKQLSLQQLVSRLLAEFQPVAVRQRSFILNDVPVDFYVNADEATLESAIRTQLSNAITRCLSTCIRVSASKAQDIVEIYVPENAIRFRNPPLPLNMN